MIDIVFDIFVQIRKKYFCFYEEFGNYELACVSITLDLSQSKQFYIEQLKQFSTYYLNGISITKIQNIKLKMLQSF